MGDWTEQGKAIVEKFAAGDYTGIAAACTPETAAAMPAEMAEQIWGQICAQVGAYKEIQSAEHTETDGYHVVNVTTAFEHAALIARVAFDSGGKIAGLNFAPAG